jgi:glutathione S-transferase
MTAPFRLYGAELSPYSVKVRSYLRYKGVPFEWLARTNARQEEFAKYAKLPLVPVLVDADENAMQDSTPMIEALEKQFEAPSIVPDDAALAFVSALLEDYADEWLNKAMFHYRWSYPEDQASAAKRIVEMIFEGTDVPEGIEESVRTRMIGRLHHVGSSAEATPVIEGSFGRVIGLLEALLGTKDYLFGGKPTLADFGLAGQLKQLLSDPTPGAVLKAQAPNLVRWVDRMDDPKAGAGFVSLDAVREPLAALLREEVAGAYLQWMAANASAVADDAPGVSVEVAGATFSQKPQRYAAKAFSELKRKRGAVEDDALAALLGETGVDAFLLSADESVDDVEPEAADDNGEDGDDSED